MKKHADAGGKGTKGKGTKGPTAPRARSELVRARTLEEIWMTLREGFQPAENKLVDYLEAAYHGLRLGNFAVDDPDEHVRRRTSPHRYVSYGPPAWFEAPFCILKVFVREENQEYMTHGGEELLFNLAGSAGVEYQFFWRQDSPAPWQRGGDTDFAVTVQPEQLIRINPSLPHRNRPIAVRHTDGVPATEATAWIILRPLSLSPATLILHTHAGATIVADSEKPHHQFTRERLEKMTGAQFLLIASGLLEKLRVHRLRSEMSVEELSTDCGLNRSYVGRLERLDFENFSIQTLYELSRQIDLDLLSCLRQLQWAHHVQACPPVAGTDFAPFVKPPALGAHSLHPSMIRLPKGESCKLELFESSAEIVSVIVIRGEMVPRLSGEKNVPVVEAGHVFHARYYPGFTIHALTDLEALVIRCSQRCSCANSDKEHK